MWHQHQPYYPDDVAGENPMPWVRLHGTKDYLGMALHLEEVPGVPLHDQPGAEPAGADSGVRRRRRPTGTSTSRGCRPTGWSATTSLYLLDNFFMAYADTMIRPHPAVLGAVPAARRWAVDPAEQALTRFRARDLRDLQVWSNLAWFHPLLFEKDAELAEFLAKGRRYTEDEKQWLLDRQREILAQIIPLHRKLAERGQVELTTTPFYHPILPLLFDKRLAREAMPDVRPAAYRDGYPEDAEVHVRRAVESHTRAVRPAARGACGRARGRSARRCSRCWPTRHRVDRHRRGDPRLFDQRHGRPRRPGPRPPSGDALPRPGRSREGEPRAGDRLPRSRACPTRSASTTSAAPDRSPRETSSASCTRSATPAGTIRPTLVPVILDGENCWEYFPDGGVVVPADALSEAVRDPRRRAGDGRRVPRASTRRRTRCPAVRREAGSATISPSGSATRKTTGAGTRSTTRGGSSWRRPQSGRHDPAMLARAWEEMYIAEGSDWFWWYGDDHSQRPGRAVRPAVPQAPAERLHPAGRDPPGSLFTPISQAGGHRPVHTISRRASCDVKVDGRPSYFEWIDARHVTSAATTEAR